MQPPIDYTFPRYLAAKKSVDDRALNRQVWDTLAVQLQDAPNKNLLRVLEIGAGIGTMIERMLEWKLLPQAHYTALDSLPENAEAALLRLSQWAAQQNRNIISEAPFHWHLQQPNANKQFEIEYLAEDLFEFIQRQDLQQKWDLLVAHAFLDLVDMPTTLPLLRNLLSAQGSFYFSLNFDGATIFEPAIDPPFDRLVENLYHRSMDERYIHGQPCGDSQTGRRLFDHLGRSGFTITAAGASDWVVFPRNGVYPHDEAYFLDFIIHTIHQALSHHPELDPHRFEAWITKRRQQIKNAELVYIAHQLDFVGKLTGS